MNSPIYQLLCQTLQNKIKSDQKDPSINTGTDTMMGSKNMASATSSKGNVLNNQRNSKQKHEKQDLRIHQTNPESGQQLTSNDQRERMSNKSAINQTNNNTNWQNCVNFQANEPKTKRTNMKNSGTIPTRQTANRNRAPMQNIPLSFVKSYNNAPNGNRQNTGRGQHGSNVVSISLYFLIKFQRLN